ncbi:MAG TPA: hypothetical protein PLV92_19090, partial [Pirellulaceae bacterium]|nr:hypothetical protein [Pirellulaceae bacterium]
VRGLAVDGAGNVVVTGEFTGTVAFGDHSVTSVGNMDFFVAKIDAQGKWLWVRTGGGDKIDRGYAVAADAAGNCYVTGHFESATARFGDVEIATRGDYDLFVAKYSPEGKLEWLKSGGGPGYDYGHGIAADKAGRLFVTGAVVGEGEFNGRPIGAVGPSHMFCLALFSDGNELWRRTAMGAGASSGHGVATDGKGNCYVGGYAAGGTELGGVLLSDSPGQDLLIAKFDVQGKLGWTYAGHGSSSAMAHEIAADENGNVWAVGMFKGDLKLADRTVASQGQHDLLVTRFDQGGRRLWTKTAGGVGIDYGLGIATDGHGNCYMTGSFTGRVEFDGVVRESQGPASDIQIVKYDGEGRQLWFLQGGGPRTDHAYPIASDGRGAIYLSGACSGEAKFGPLSLPHQGSNDIFVVKLDESK